MLERAGVKRRIFVFASVFLLCLVLLTINGPIMSPLPEIVAIAALAAILWLSFSYTSSHKKNLDQELDNLFSQLQNSLGGELTKQKIPTVFSSSEFVSHSLKFKRRNAGYTIEELFIISGKGYQRYVRIKTDLPVKFEAEVRYQGGLDPIGSKMSSLLTGGGTRYGSLLVKTNRKADFELFFERNKSNLEELAKVIPEVFQSLNFRSGELVVLTNKHATGPVIEILDLIEKIRKR